MRKEYTTKTRQLIIEYVKQNKSKQFSAAELYDYLQQQKVEINLATIYRNLDRLQKEGVLMRYKYADNNSCLFQYTGESEQCWHHLHMKCQMCGGVIHLGNEFMEKIMNHLLKNTGFSIICKDSILTGICKNCKTKE